MTVTLDNIPSKFHPFIIGNPKCSANAPSRQMIEEVFSKPLVDLKDGYVFDGGFCVLKLPRKGPIGTTTSDTHLYRVRKAEKVRKYLLEHNLGESFTVPNKYLYWHDKEKQFYVVCEKIDLSETVATPHPDFEASIQHTALILGGQCQLYCDGKPTKAISPEQAKALAELATLGLTDLSYNNIFFDKKGRIAIIDTEPVKRLFKKILAFPKFGFWFGDKAGTKAQQTFTGTAKLKMCCIDPAARKEVEKVEQRHLLWNLAKIITKIALVCLAIYFLPTAISSLSLPILVAKTLKISLIGIAALKVIFLALNTLSIYAMWKWSQSGLTGLAQICQTEQKGMV